jgi:hypothetical protein
MMKKNLISLLLIFLSAIFLIGCTQTPQPDKVTLSSENINIMGAKLDLGSIDCEQRDFNQKTMGLESGESLITFRLDLSYPKDYSSNGLFTCYDNVDGQKFSSYKRSEVYSEERYPFIKTESGSSSAKFNIYKDHQLEVCCTLKGDFGEVSNEFCKTMLVNEACLK